MTVKTNAGGTAFRLKVTGDATSYKAGDTITIDDENVINVKYMAVGESKYDKEHDEYDEYDPLTATGKGAFAVGIASVANGEDATALGLLNHSTGIAAVSVGWGNEAKGTFAVAMGKENNAKADYAAALGKDNSAYGISSSAIGVYNQVGLETDEEGKASKQSSAVGYYNMVFGTQSSGMGYWNYVEGDQSSGFGSSNTIYGNQSVAVGHNNIIGEPGTTQIDGTYVFGANNTVMANNAIVLGAGVTTVADNSVVIGAGSSSEEANTVSIGAAATTKEVDGKQVDVAEVTRRIVHVADGKANTDAATYGQLVNNATYELKVGKETEIKNNANGTAFKLKVSLDNGSIESGDAGYVTGGDLYEELRPASDGTYVKTGESTATNLSALDTQVKANKDKIDTVEGNVTKLQGDVSTLDTKVSAMEGNITTMNTKIDGLKLDGGTYTFTKENNYSQAIQYANGGDAFTITIEDLGGEGASYKAGNGIAISDDDEISVNVAENGGLTADEKGLSVKLAENGGLTVDDKGLAVQKDGVVASGNTGIVTGGTVHSAILAKTGDTTKLVSAGLGDNLTDGVLAVNNKIGYLSDDINKVGAGAAALAALRPEAFDPMDKWSFAVGYGHYKNANSGALGVFFKPNEDTTVSFGGTVGNNDALMNAGVSFKLGTRSAKMGLYRTDAAVSQELASLRKNNDRLTADNQILKEDNIEQSKRIANLEANNERMQRQIVAILSRMGMLNRVSKTAK